MFQSNSPSIIDALSPSQQADRIIFHLYNVGEANKITQSQMSTLKLHVPFERPSLPAVSSDSDTFRIYIVGAADARSRPHCDVVPIAPPTDGCRLLRLWHVQQRSDS